MAEIRINEDKVNDASARLESLVQTELMDGIISRYKALEDLFSISCGDAAEAIIESLKKEENALSGLACLMQKLNKYISDSAESFSQLDKDYDKAFKADKSSSTTGFQYIQTEVMP